ncbi:hypothetical protein L6452_42655 [Arctium lappa]|uniref:Uncharacterized protein n=1 Tax=Arctium lappa TaxID=4217 RepID=A0ACB8XJJ7_ARCLA|nr:hypothetical protein L6452_42655 [Arctium lappa]
MEMRRRLVMHKNMEREVKNLEREDQKIHKELQVLDKRIVLPSGEDNGLSVVYQSETSKSVSAQTNLRLVFKAMERFIVASLKACEELLQRIEEDKGDTPNVFTHEIRRVRRKSPETGLKPNREVGNPGSWGFIGIYHRPGSKSGLSAFPDSDHAGTENLNPIGPGNKADPDVPGSRTEPKATETGTKPGVAETQGPTR